MTWRNWDLANIGLIAACVLAVGGFFAVVVFGEIEVRREKRLCLESWKTCPVGHLTVYMRDESRCLCAIEVRP